jgi:HD-GYP domain-containing protein (c-di-GMP phosphodiesterase class II)
MYMDVPIIDTFDAMTSLTPHRRAMPVGDVIGEMEKRKGKQCDPRILEIF